MAKNGGTVDMSALKQFTALNEDLLIHILNSARKTGENVNIEELSPEQMTAYEAMYIILRDYYVPYYNDMPDVQKARDSLRHVYTSIVSRKQKQLTEQLASIKALYKNQGGWKYLKWGMSEDEVRLLFKVNEPNEGELYKQEHLMDNGAASYYCDIYGDTRSDVRRNETFELCTRGRIATKDTPYDPGKSTYFYFWKEKLIAVVWKSGRSKLADETFENHPIVDTLKKEYPKGEIIKETIKLSNGFSANVAVSYTHLTLPTSDLV